MNTQTYYEREMPSPQPQPCAGGTAYVFSDRCPGKATPNEDSAALISFGDGAAVLAVADGLGGAAAGQHASRLAVEQLTCAVEEAATNGQVLQGAILQGFERANEAIQLLGVGAGTTMSVVEIDGQQIRPYHAGDSEILVVGGRGKVKLQTVSHSPVGYAVEAGILDKTEAMKHEERHIVSNIIGSPNMRIEIGSTIRLAPRDTLLLASDGLTDNLHEHEIIETIRKGPLAKVADRLTCFAHGRMENPNQSTPSKPDDLTLIIYRLDPTTRTSPSSSLCGQS